MDVFCVQFCYPKNTAFSRVIRQKYDKLWTNMGIVFVNISRGCAGCLRLRTTRSVRLCGRVFRGAGLWGGNLTFVRVLKPDK